MSDKLLFDVREGVATLTLNRPDRLNAFDDELLEDLGRRLKAVEHDDEVRCVVITGAGRAFSAGQDLASLRERDEDPRGRLRFREHLETTYNRIVRTIRGIEKPVVASINGVAAGAGASMALACDIRLAAESSSIVMAFAAVGLIPDTGSTWLLPHMVGYSRAFELYATQGRLDAHQALAERLVSRVVPDDQLADATTELASTLAAGPTRALALTKRAMQRSFGISLDAALDNEAQLQEIAGRTDDHAEGLAAFLEKRKPRFTGR